MAKVRPCVLSFVGGLISPRLEGRVDLAKYGVGCRELTNAIVTPTGGVYKRPGTRFVARAKGPGVRLVPFDFNGTESQSYVLEVGSGYIRFFSRGGQVTGAGGAPLELAVPALAGLDLTRLRYVQSADCLYFAHPNLPPARLERLSATSWAWQPMRFLTSRAAPLPFGEGNYPSLVRIYEDRLIYGATPREPLNIWMSRTADFINFNINTNVDQSGEPLAEDAIFLRVGGSRVNPLRWMLDLEQLVVGTNAGEIRIQGADMDSPLTPQTTGHRRQSSYGSGEVEAILLGSSAMFVSRTGTSVYTLDYQDFGYRFRAAPLNLLCPEVTAPGVVEMHAQTEPEPIVWCILGDGTLAGCTYIRDQQIYAWHRHTTAGKVTGGAVIPAAGGDQLWLAVEREGGTFIEYLETPFDPLAEDATFTVMVDSMLSGTVAEAGRVRGAAHLAGQGVQLVVNGAYAGEVTVAADGTISHPALVPQAYVVAGLPYTADIVPLRPNYASGGADGPGGLGVFARKRVVGVRLRVLGSVMGQVRAENGPDSADAGPWQELPAWPAGTVVRGDSPPPCQSRVVRVMLGGNHGEDGGVRIRQSLPLPLYVVSLEYGLEQQD